MKRMIKLLLCLALAAALLAGCGGQQTNEPSVTTIPTESAGVKSVSTVDEFLAAIGSDVEIVMEPGVYDLSTASNYGMDSDNPFYSWQDSFNGYELKLKGVQNLTISGSGSDMTTIKAKSSYANVLILQNCSNVILQDFTAGHMEDLPGECTGGVLVLEGSMGVTMERLGLYGCGVTGLRTDLCMDVRISDSDIYDCSSSGISLEGSDDIVIENCRFYDIGNSQWGGSAVFYIYNSENVEITGCEVRDNVVQSLVNSSNGRIITLKNNAFTGNRPRNSAFSLWTSDMVMDGNTFEGNNIRIWYDMSMDCVTDSEGNLLTEEKLEELYPQPVVDGSALPEQTEVHVTTVDEFIAAIAPNTKIVLDAALYDFSTATGYGTSSSEYHSWEDIFDGPGLVITNVDNLTICSNDGNVKGHTFTAVPRYADVLTFSQCSNITLQGFTAGHTKEQGECTGGVLYFRDCDSVLVDNCSLYGCGTLGVEAEYSGNIRVTNCEIYECSYGGIRMWSVDGANVENCTFRDLGGSQLAFSECKNVTVNGEELPGDFYSED